MLGLGGVDRARGHDQLLGAAEPDDGRQASRAADVGDDAELDLRQAELGVAGGDAQVAAERDLQRAADARVVDLADDRLGHLFAEVGAVHENFAKRAQIARLTGGLSELDEVHAGREHGPFAAQHDAVHVAVGGGLAQRLAERAQQLLVHRVALLRAVEDDVADRAAVLGYDDAHRWAPGDRGHAPGWGDACAEATQPGMTEPVPLAPPGSGAGPAGPAPLYAEPQGGGLRGRGGVRPAGIRRSLHADARTGKTFPKYFLVRP